MKKASLDDLHDSIKHAGYMVVIRNPKSTKFDLQMCQKWTNTIRHCTYCFCLTTVAATFLTLFKEIYFPIFALILSQVALNLYLRKNGHKKHDKKTVSRPGLLRRETKQDAKTDAV